MAIKSDIFDEFEKVRFKITKRNTFEPIRISLSQIINQSFLKSFTFCKILNKITI